MADQYFQGVNPPAAPPVTTPTAGAAVPGQFDAVPVQDMDIQAPMEDLTGAFDAANSLAGAGVLYGQGPRQAEAQALLDSPQGSGAVNVTSGFPDGENTSIMPDYSPGLGTDHNPVPLPLIIGGTGDG